MVWLLYTASPSVHQLSSVLPRACNATCAFRRAGAPIDRQPPRLLAQSDGRVSHRFVAVAVAVGPAQQFGSRHDKDNTADARACSAPGGTPCRARKLAAAARAVDYYSIVPVHHSGTSSKQHCQSATHTHTEQNTLLGQSGGAILQLQLDRGDDIHNQNQIHLNVSRCSIWKCTLNPTQRVNGSNTQQIAQGGRYLWSPIKCNNLYSE